MHARQALRIPFTLFRMVFNSNLVFDPLNRIFGYDRVLYLLGGLKPFQKNPHLRNLLKNRVESAIERYGFVEDERPIVLSNGIKIAVCDQRDFLQRNLYYLRGYSLEEQALIASYLQPGDTFIDVGANIGVFSLMAAEKVGPTGSVVAFEPASDTSARLWENVELNGFEDRITILQCALADEKGELALFDSDVEANDLGKRSFFQHGKAIETVPVRVFDELVADGTVVLNKPVGALKIDVEGAELLVLEGMRNFLKQHKPKVVLVESLESQLSWAGTGLRDLENFFSQHGYRKLPGTADDKKPYDDAFVPA